MPYLNVDVDYPNHPKTIRLKALIGPEADIFPIRLWAYVGKYHCESGDLKQYTAREIENVCGYAGKSGSLVSALLKVGYLEKNGCALRVKDWLQHEGHIAAFKQRGRMAALQRWNKLKPRKHKSKHATSIPQAMLNSKSSNAPTKPTKPTIPTKPTKRANRDSGPKPAALADLWNEKAHKNFARVQNLGKSRLAKLKARLVEKPDLKWWDGVIQRMGKSSFLTGQVPDKEWRATLDWLTRNDENASKVLEGIYDDKANLPALCVICKAQQSRGGSSKLCSECARCSKCNTTVGPFHIFKRTDGTQTSRCKGCRNA